MTFWQHSNHYPLLIHVKIRLKHKEFTTPGKPILDDPEAIEGFTEQVNIWADHMMQNHTPPTYEQLAVHMTTLRGRLPIAQSTMWRPYITEATKELIRQRDAAAKSAATRPDPEGDLKQEHHRLKQLVKNTHEWTGRKDPKTG